MFKKTTIAILATFLMLASSMAQAVYVNEAGSRGQVLVFPYYNVNNLFSTSFNITNTTKDYKALKVRFRESENSNDVLDFNVYMSPFDVFTMVLTKANKGGVLLRTTDNTCTHPTIPTDGVLFRHAAYDSTDTGDVQEGYLEIIEMGIVDPTASLIDGTIPQFIASQGILHDNDGIPFDCTVIERAWQTGVFTQGGAAANVTPIDLVNPRSPGYPLQNTPSLLGWYGQPVVGGVLPPTGGLVGSEILIDSGNIAGFVAEPISIENYSSTAQHYLSSDENFYLLPSLASGDSLISERRAAPVTYGTVIRDWGLDDRNVLPRTSVPSGINPFPIADALLVTELGNQYFLGPNTFTDWVISAPMRKHGIYNDFQYVSAPVVPLTALPIGAIPVHMTDPDVGPAEKLSLANANGYWAWLNARDVHSSIIYFDREEGSAIPEPGDFSPPIQQPLAEVQVIREVNIFSLVYQGSDDDFTIQDGDTVLGSDNSIELGVNFRNGWGLLTFRGYDLNDGRYAAWQTAQPAVSARGVPLTGFMAARGEVRDGNVGESFPHFYSKAY